MSPLAAPRGLILDGWSAADAGFVPETGLRGKDGGAEVDWPATDVPGRIGQVVVASRPRWRTRKLSVPGHVLGSDLATVNARLDELKWRLRMGEGELDVVFVDDETRRFTARSATVEVRGLDPELWPNQQAKRVEVLFEMLDPRVYDVAQTTVALTATLAELPLGTAPVSPILRVNGPVSGTVVFTYADSAGATVATMTLNTTLAGGEWLDVDCLEQTLTDNGGTERPEDFVSGEFIELNPHDGDYPAGASPALPQLSISTGDGEARYHKAWL